MRKAEKAVVKEDISPNLIPMIDIMFLLLLFFMLGADMTQRDAQPLVLPRADQAVLADPAAGLHETTISIHHESQRVACSIAENGGLCRDASHWKWTIQGRDYDAHSIRPELQLLADVDPEPESSTASRRLSARKILIRADEHAPYGDVQQVIESSAAAGLNKIEVAAALPVSKPTR